MTQTSLWDKAIKAIQSIQRETVYKTGTNMYANCKPLVGSASSQVPKLSPQCRKLLDAFLSAPNNELWNYEIVRNLYILNHTGRISDLRKAGYKIEEVKKEGGCRLYQLILPGKG